MRFDPVVRDTQKHAQEMGEIEQYEFQQEAVMKRAEEIAAEMITPDGYSDNGVIYNMDDVTEHVFSNEKATERFHFLLACVADDSDIFADHIVLKDFLLKQATEIAEDIAWREAG